MTEKEVIDYIVERLKEELPPSYKDAEISVEEITKNNGCTHRHIVVRQEDEPISPSISLENILERTMTPSELDDAVKELSKTVQRAYDSRENPGEMLDMFQSFDAAKSQVFVKLINAKRNEEVLSQVPYTMVGDLAATYRVKVSSPDPDRVGSFLVTNFMMHRYGIDKAQLHEAAQTNAMRDVVVKTLGGMVRELQFANNAEVEKAAGFPMTEELDTTLVVTNRDLVNGAGVIAFDPIRQHIAAVLDGDYFVIPSSIHETIVMKDESRNEQERTRTAKQLSMMVKEVNQTIASPEEFLSNEVYHYDAIKRTLSMETGIDRTMQQEHVRSR